MVTPFAVALSPSSFFDFFRGGIQRLRGAPPHTHTVGSKARRPLPQSSPTTGRRRGAPLRKCNTAGPTPRPASPAFLSGAPAHTRARLRSHACRRLCAGPSHVRIRKVWSSMSPPEQETKIGPVPGASIPQPRTGVPPCALWMHACRPPHLCLSCRAAAPFSVHVKFRRSSA